VAIALQFFPSRSSDDGAARIPERRPQDLRDHTVSLSPKERENERDLIERIRAGDDTAFECVVHTYYADLCAYVASFTRRDDRAEEIVQDLLFNVWRLGAQWTVTGSIAGYLFAAARHAASRDVARERRGVQWSVSGHASDVHGMTPVAPDVSLLQRDLNTAIAHAVDALPERSREAFVLTRRVGVTYADAARIMGVSVKTVETQVRLALHALRQRLAPWKGDVP